ncbi:MAG: peptidoglycan DD-metalloendopeptidase family protein [Bacteroidales bacterium]|jgi:murein DD-endopeptidase MepM/ murein hydrolase activator NlpD|nr:peptidoglycan DD-metalloendopeptidase family protein [Bacteroidales bacterium]
MHKKRVPVLIILLVIIGFISFINPFSPNIVKNDKNIFSVGIDENIIFQDIDKEFDITVDSFYVVAAKVKRNQNLALILNETGLDREIANLATYNSSKVFDIRNIRLGNRYKLYFSKDNDSLLKYFVYEHSSTEYLKIDLNNDPVAIRGEKPIQNIRKTSYGEVTTSLWNTMIENNIDPLMAIRLSEIYAWTVDFFGLDRGDKFKVIYDAQYVDSIPVGIGRIYAASFIHKGEELMAYEFTQNGETSYYDEHGKSLRRQLLKAPLRFSRISSGFSKGRMHPILKIVRPHSGVDYVAPTGTPVYTVGDGVVVEKGYSKSAGNYIKVKHNSVYTTGYNHFSKFASGMFVGAKVKQGQVIGYVGSTGYSTGSHLDYRVWMNGQAINPLKIKAPPIEPIKGTYLPEFKAAVDSLNNVLKSSI